MKQDDFNNKVDIFRGILNNLVNGVIDTDRSFVSETLEGKTRATIRIGPRTGDPLSQWIPLRRVRDDRPLIFLHVSFDVETDRTGEHLQVGSSGFYLLTKSQKKKRPRPIVRVEYDRTRTGLGKAAAHLHVHALSPDLAWLYGTSRQDSTDLHKLHFPVGGRLFRPTLEDFLLFLDREKIFDNWKPQWRSVISASLEGWNLIQAAATVRRHEDVAITTLQELGHRIGGPNNTSTSRRIEDDAELPDRTHGSRAPGRNGVAQ